MRIVLVAPPWYEVPPDAYGGIEWVCALLADGLVERGHEVSLIGTGSSRTAADFHATFPEPPSGLGTPQGGEVERLHAARANRIIRALAPEVVHDHSAAGPLTALGRAGVPAMLTAHGPIDGLAGDLYRCLQELPLVAISDAQRRGAPDLPWIGTVHNAIPLSLYRLETRKDDFVLFMGRFSESKGAHLAIDAARTAGVPIVLAGKCDEPSEQNYFDREIRPRLGSGVDWIGEADTATKKELYERARALLCPVQWEEPFGLVMVEAMACGTPVVALRRGSVPELVVDGVTGFVCDAPEELAAGILRLDAIDAADCRAHVEAHFRPEIMVEAYEALYARLVLSATRVS
jgi:glycosyltransferase involved in cell wall biosynthesis